MMITMLPLSAVTAFAADTSAPTGTASYGDYAYDYTINTKDGTATITKFRVLVDGLYDITIPEEFALRARSPEGKPTHLHKEVQGFVLPYPERITCGWLPYYRPL